MLDLYKPLTDIDTNTFSIYAIFFKARFLFVVQILTIVRLEFGAINNCTSICDGDKHQTKEITMGKPFKIA